MRVKMEAGCGMTCGIIGRIGDKNILAGGALFSSFDCGDVGKF